MADADYTTSPPVRWNARSIRKAILCPKPRGAVRRYDESVRARGEPVGWLLSHIVQHADIIHDGRPLDRDSGVADHSGAWQSAAKSSRHGTSSTTSSR